MIGNRKLAREFYIETFTPRFLFQRKVETFSESLVDGTVFETVRIRKKGTGMPRNFSDPLVSE